MRKKPRHKDDYEFQLEVQIRELKALNRSLLKELKKRNKGIYKSELDLEPIYDKKDIQEKPKQKDCFNCGKGILLQTKVRHLTFESCNICEYKKKL